MSSSILDISTASSNASQTATTATANTKSSTIPLSRIRTIMKSSPEVSHINQDTLQCVAKATELFIQTITRESFKKQANKKELNYENLASLVSKNDQFQFLSEIVPFKMKLKDALRLIEVEQRKLQK